MKNNVNILRSIIAECNKHLERLNYAYKKILPLSPFTENGISNLTDEDIAHIDQMIYRFSKLQDAVGHKLFKAVLIILDEEVTNKSAIDIFNRLEQLEVIDDYQRWKELRELRNELAHEYEEILKETAAKLNLLLAKKSDLDNYLNDILKYLKKKGFSISV